MARIYLSPPHMGPEERALLLEAFDSNWIAPLGPHVDAFEREMCAVLDVGHAAALSSGTAALHLGLLLMGIEPGQHVITSSLTFAATANVIRYVGAEPIFIDSDRASWNMDPTLLAEELATSARRGELPAAVIAVDIYGQCADYDAISALCDEHGVPLIEDAAEALGATSRGRSAGSFGELSTLSFNGNKIITTSGGGMLLSNHKELVEQARFLSTQARDPAPHYQHSYVGYNYRMSNLLAAVGRGQLKQLPNRVAARRRINERYQARLGQLPGLTFMPEAAYGHGTRWLTCLLVDEAAFGTSNEAIRLALERHDIEARPVWKPMHLQPIFSDCRVCGGEVSEQLFAQGLCLPSGSALSDEELDRICGIVEGLARR